MSTGLTTHRDKRRSIIGFGAFAAVTMVLMIWILTEVNRLAAVSDGYHVFAYYDDVALLKVNDPVRVAGVTVGSVTDYYLDQQAGNRVRVEMVIREDIKVPVDSRAEMRWANAVGMKMVLLKPGKSDRYLKDGDEIVNSVPSIESQAAALTEFGPDPQQARQQLDAGQSGLDTAEFSKTAQELADAIKEVRKDVGGIFDSATAGVDTLLDRAAVFEQMLADYEVVTKTLGKRDKQIAQMVDNIVTLADSFVGNREMLGDAIDEADKTMSAVDKILTRNGHDLDRIFDGSAKFMDMVHDHRKELFRFWKTYPALFENGFQIVNKGEFGYGTGVCGQFGPPPCWYPMHLPWGEVPPGWAPPFFPPPPEGWVPVPEGEGKQPDGQPKDPSSTKQQTKQKKQSPQAPAAPPSAPGFAGYGVMVPIDSAAELRQLLIGGK